MKILNKLIMNYLQVYDRFLVHRLTNEDPEMDANFNVAKC